MINFLLKLFLIIFVFFIAIFISKSKKISAKIKIIAIILFCGTLLLLPIDTIIPFSGSPKEVFTKTTMGKFEIIAEGEESAAVFYKKYSGPYSIMFMIKNDIRYKKTAFHQIEKIQTYSHDTLIIDIYQVRNTSDYYISISGFVNENLDISDNQGSIFNIFILSRSNEKNRIACLESIQYCSDYELYVNGERVMVD